MAGRQERKKILEVAVILDRSGSMQTAREDHEGGLNSFVRDQRDFNEDDLFTLIQFDSTDPCEVVYDAVPLKDVGEIHLIPRGGTPLSEAVIRSVAHIEKGVLDRGTKEVVVMVITDGQETTFNNEYNKPNVKKLVASQEAKGWKFLFLAANVDAFSEGGAFGFGVSTTSGFINNSVGTRAMYAANSANLITTKGLIERGESFDSAYESLSYTDEQKKAMNEEDNGTIPSSSNP